MQKPLRNYAFIDSQNLNLSIQDCGWKLDFQRFRVYLKEKWGVEKAYLFLGYIHENANMYRVLQEYGYVLIFKPILQTKDGKIKGNVDAELVLQAMIDYNKYHKAVIVTSDGDFHCLVKYFYEQDKLERLIVPNRYQYSVLLRRAFFGKPQITFLNDLRRLLEYKRTTPG